MVADAEKLTGVEAYRTNLDNDYREHTHAHEFKAWINGQVRRGPPPSSARRE